MHHRGSATNAPALSITTLKCLLYHVYLLEAYCISKMLADLSLERMEAGITHFVGRALGSEDLCGAMQRAENSDAGQSWHGV